MSCVFFLDSGPLGMVTHPRGDERTRACAAWFERQLEVGRQFVLPEIVDYEFRREMLRMRKDETLRKLAIVRSSVTFLPLNSAAMTRAAELWAFMRQRGLATADEKALDVDVILSAQRGLFAAAEACRAVVVTDNVGHLARLGEAAPWDALPRDVDEPR